MRMIVRLDHGTETETFEEVLALQSEGTALCRWFIWREADAVFVQPLLGRSQRYNSVFDAIEALTPQKRIAQTHIRATRWPKPVSDKRPVG